MKVTVTTTSQPLKAMFTTEQRQQIQSLSPKQSTVKIYILSVVGSGTLWVENWKEANSSYSTARTEASWSFPIEVESFSDINVVAGSGTVDVRILPM
jgi:hypothetical protein